ncbi:DUF2480 family protein [Pontibacter sp. G13]|uniref:DUF2480 family protein n=1 Tax=Pontibacter sp. G13 TaxID=3074898 RepID=UPI00288B06FB|nr:DUF2480 family protein [Pontibacter sp. G13]WNJ21408.1 DUF2480 family protein [Pontibacter sp. G13]
MSEVVNRIANSPLITFKLEDYHTPGERVLLDIKDQLFRGLILRERDFRAWVKEHDWTQYAGKHVAITCSVDTIIQVWAYMLLEVKLQPHAESVVFGSLEDLEISLYFKQLDQIDFEQYADRPVVIKGCSDIDIPAAVYVEATRRLMPLVKKLSYGEPCSTVPIYKRT